MNNKMSDLAESFHVLADRPGVRPWDPEKFDNWLSTSAAPTHAGREAGCFLLSVWNPTTPWASGNFDLHGALQCWDASMRAAFVAWAENPWWP